MSSRFKELFEQASKEEEQPEEIKSRQRATKKAITKSSAQKTAKVKGKRSNPDYTGAFAYIPIELHDEIKIKLLRNKELDFSGLVEKLLSEWLQKQK